MRSSCLHRFAARLRLRFLAFTLTFFVSLTAVPVEEASAGHVVFVKIYVDEEEATTERVWKARLSERVRKASDIISQYTDVKFAVSGYGVWSSDNRIQNLSRSLREFEQEVTTTKERLAIAFSSQYKFQGGRAHLGGTRGPLKHHILIRENARSVLEAERLEVLVHELGHFLCSGHSNSTTSAMRPVVGDGQARAKSFQIGFDPVNAKIMRLVGNEMRDRRVDKFDELSPATLKKMGNEYLKLARALPDDKSAIRYLYRIRSILQFGGAPAKTLPTTLPTGSEDLILTLPKKK